MQRPQCYSQPCLMKQKVDRCNSIAYSQDISRVQHLDSFVSKKIEMVWKFIVYRQLIQQFQPSSEARSLSLLQAFMQAPAFTKEKPMLEQVLGLERLW